MALFLLENRDFLGFRMIFKVWLIPFIASFKIWNVGVSVITRSTFSSLLLKSISPVKKVFEGET